jgi:peptide/nickel transport system permease protein
MIFVLVMSINLLGDGVRDVLDPRLKSGVLSRPAQSTLVERQELPPRNEAGEDVVLDVNDLQTRFRLGDEVYCSAGGVSFQLKRRECLGLVGESGSGKSVTALSLLGLVPSPPGVITGGRVDYHGEDLLAVSDERRRGLRGNRIAYIFQDPLSTLHPLFSVGEQIVEAIRSHRPVSYREAWKKAVGLLDQVRIPNAAQRAKAYPHQLSGGMRQRVGIAMALANDAEVLITDEPTTALDVTVQAEVLKLLDKLRDEKHSSLLFITHDFGVVSELCDRVAVMYAGRIVELGETVQVLERPLHPYTRKLIDCVPILGQPERRLDAIEGLPPPLNHLPQGCHFAPRCPHADDVCREQDQNLEPLGPDRLVRCHKALEVPA